MGGPRYRCRNRNPQRQRRHRQGAQPHAEGDQQVTRKDYRIIADAIAAAMFRIVSEAHRMKVERASMNNALAAVGELRGTLEIAFKRDNPNFDASRFRDAIEE